MTEVELVHHHLPKLEDADHIEWDRQTGELSKGTDFDHVIALLDLVESHAAELPQTGHKTTIFIQTERPGQRRYVP